eukprot:493558_1
MALKLNPTCLKAGRLIGYKSINSQLNTITLVVIRSIDYLEEKADVVDIDQIKETETMSVRKSFRDLCIVAPVVTVGLSEKVSELSQYALEGCVPVASYNIQEVYYSFYPINNSLLWLEVISFLKYIEANDGKILMKSNTINVSDPFENEKYDMTELYEQSLKKWNKKQNNIKDDIPDYSILEDDTIVVSDDTIKIYPVVDSTNICIIVDTVPVNGIRWATLDFGLSQCVASFTTTDSFQSINVILEKKNIYSYGYPNHFKWLGSYSAILLNRFQDNVKDNGRSEKGNGFRRFELERKNVTPSLSTYTADVKPIMQKRLAILVPASKCKNSEHIGKRLVIAAGYKKGTGYTMDEMEKIINKSMIAAVQHLQQLLEHKIKLDKQMIRKSLMKYVKKKELTLFVGCNDKTIETHIKNIMSIDKPKHWSYKPKYQTSILQWIHKAQSLKTTEKAKKFLRM